MKKLAALLMFVATACLAQGERFELSVPPPTDGKLQVQFRIQAEHYLYADQVEVSVNGEVLKHISAPEPVIKPDPVTGEDVKVFTGDATLAYAVPDSSAGYDVRVSYLGCNDSVCFRPEEREFSFGKASAAAEKPEPVTGHASASIEGFRIAGAMSGYVKEEPFMEFLENSLTETDAAPSGFAGRGAVITILLILLGGLALNLTPCVLPMIPINLAIIGAGVGTDSKSRGFLLGGAYGAGIALVYGVLGLVVLLTNSTFGTLNSSPWFNMGVAAVFTVLALSMFGVFNIDLSRLQGKIKTGDSNRGKVIVSFFLGGIAALLAGACVAPVVISVLLLAADLYQKGNPAGLLLPFILGLGMALPWPFAGAGISVLPKPGAWMEKIKYGFGVIILVGAGYYALLGAALLQDRSENRRFEVVSAQENRIKEGWHTDLESALSVSRLNGKPVFVDFWASWCKNCLKMEKTTFKSADVKDKLKGFVKVKYRAEDPRDPATKAVLDSFDIVGLPTYVVLVPDDKE